jgi:hypothetical protein
LHAEPSSTLTVRDNRTGRTYELDIRDGAIRATDLRRIKGDDADHGLMTYDPGLVNTAIARSSVTYLDGEAGILQYRGYPIEQLAESCTYLEVAYLLICGRRRLSARNAATLPLSSPTGVMPSRSVHWHRSVKSSRCAPSRTVP